MLKIHVHQTPPPPVSWPREVISRTTQLVRGLRDIDAFGSGHIRVGNNSAEVITAVIAGISGFRDELVSPADLLPFPLYHNRILVKQT